MEFDSKDYEVALMMFKDVSPERCKLVSGLRKYGLTEPFCNGWNIVWDTRYPKHCGWLIPNKDGLFATKVEDSIKEESDFIKKYLMD